MAAPACVVVRSINGEEILGPLETEGVTALKMQLKSLPAWSEGDISLMTSEGEILTTASPLTGGTAAEPLVLTAVLSEQTWQAVVWGCSVETQSYRELADELTSGLTALVAGKAGFAAIKRGGRCIFWRSDDSDDEELADAVPAPHSELSEGVQKVYVNDEAFAAIKEGGQVLAWGSRSGGGFISEDVAERLQSGVKSITHTAEAFAALKETGEVVTWGQPNFGGNCDSIAEKLVDVVSITGAWGSSDGAFAALTATGACVAWGSDSAGGDCGEVAEQLRSGVTSISSTASAFAALKETGAVVTWGDAEKGGRMEVTWGPPTDEEECSDDGCQEDGESEDHGETYSVEDRLSSGVVSVVGSDNVFAALKDTGEVVAWGCAQDGAHLTEDVKRKLSEGAPIKSISAATTTFAALKEDGRVVPWGVIADFGGGFLLEQVEEKLTDVVSVPSMPTENVWGMFAIKKTGEVVPIGHIANAPDHVIEDEFRSGVVDVDLSSSSVHSQ
eukprot:s3827_g2.t1